MHVFAAPIASRIAFRSQIGLEHDGMQVLTLAEKFGGTCHRSVFDCSTTICVLAILTFPCLRRRQQPRCFCVSVSSVATSLLYPHRNPTDGRTGRMQQTATQQELAWARRIKEAARQQPDIDDEQILDLEYLQHAIIAKENIHKALRRLNRMQKFKSKYGIQGDGSYEEGIRDIKAFRIAHPGFELSVATLFPTPKTCPGEEINIGCGDYSKFMAARLSSEESHAIVMRGFFYFFQLLSSSIPSIRSGTVLLADCSDMGVKNFSMESEKRQHQLFFEAYPIRLRQIAMMNVNFVVHFLYRLVIALFPRKIRQRFIFHYDRETFLRESEFPPSVLPIAWGGSIDDERFHQTFYQKLRERYELAESFKL